MLRTVQTEALRVRDTYNHDRLVSFSYRSLHSEAAVPDISVGGGGRVIGHIKMPLPKKKIK